jgi:hypothetical protein
MKKSSEGKRTKRLELLGYLAFCLAEKLDPKAREQITQTLYNGVLMTTESNDSYVIRDLNLIKAIDEEPESAHVPGFGFRLEKMQRVYLRMFLEA